MMVQRRMRVLLIEDNSDHAALIRRHISSVKERGIALEWVQNLADGMSRLAGGDMDAVLLDLGLPDSEATETLQRVVEQAPNTPVVVLTALNDLELATTAVQQGAQDYLVKSQINGELLVRAVHYAIERKWTEQHLKELNSTLEERVRQRTQEAERRADQLRKLAAELTQAEQRERRRLAELLHDHLQQLLVAAKMSVDGMTRRSSDPAFHSSLTQLRQLLEESIQASRSLTVELSPPVLYEAGLGAALRWLGQQTKTKYNLQIDVQVEEGVECTDDRISALLFQATRELLFNSAKYAQVDQAQVRLTSLDDHFIQLLVQDHGVGFDPEKLEKSDGGGGFGLFSIRERLEFLGGRMILQSQPGQGVLVRLIAPCGPPKAQSGSQQDAIDQQVTDAPGPPQARQEVDLPLRPKRGNGTPPPIRLVVAEDRQVLRKGLLRLLHGESDIQVVGEAADGRMAIDLCLAQQPDVVVMDVSMPNVDGLEATRQILSRLPGTRVIGLSMHDGDVMAEAMCRAGAFTYLPKDSPLDRLLAAIRGQRSAGEAAVVET